MRLLYIKNGPLTEIWDISNSELVETSADELDSPKGDTTEELWIETKKGEGK